MSKPIKLTGELLAKIQAEFIEAVKDIKMFDGKISYNKSFKWKDSEDDKAYVTFTPVAFAKMITLIQEYSGEVAWHGVVDYDPEVPNVFNIVDILVYPQLVDGANVNTDQAEYTNWLYGLDDDVFKRVRMQGHSHVNFSTTPSAVDTTHQEGILSQLEDDMFYIFMIWNKKFEHTIKIFDLKNNTLYEDKDIEVVICQDGVNLDEFIKASKEVVRSKPKPVTPPYSGSYPGYQQNAKPAATQTAAPQSAAKVVKTKPKDQPNIGTDWGSQFDDDDFGYGYGAWSGR